MSDEEWAARYAARGVPTDWEDITPELMRPAFNLYWRALESPGPADKRNPNSEAELLIHDPVAALRSANLITRDDPAPRISTMVVNHDKTLERFIMYATCLVSANPSTVGITIVKEEYKEVDRSQSTPAM